MTSFQIKTLACFSNSAYFEVPKIILDDLSRYNFNDEGGTTLFKHIVAFASFCDRHDVPFDDISCGLFTFTFEGRTKKWCQTLLTTSIHSFDQFFRESCRAFILYEHKDFNRKY